MKIIALINAFNEAHLVGRCIKNIYPYVDKIIVSDTDWPSGTKVSDDGTHEIIMRKCDENHDIQYCPSAPTNHSNPRIGEAIIKTTMMDLADPKDGDWIWIVEADEFYLKHQLIGLRDRLLLGHRAVRDYNKHWLTVSSLVFAYNMSYCHYGYNGRFFRYKKGSKFTLSNHFHWPNGEISTDAHRWHIPIAHLCNFHLKYVKPLDRIKSRSGLNTNPEHDEGYINWYENTFKIWPNNPSLALSNNPPLHGWVKGQGTTLFRYDGEIPHELEGMDLNLWGELK